MKEETQQFFIEGILTLDQKFIRKQGRYPRITIRIDETYFTLFIETPIGGVDKSCARQSVFGFYIAEKQLVKTGIQYPICDALTEVGTVTADRCI